MLGLLTIGETVKQYMKVSSKQVQYSCGQNVLLKETQMLFVGGLAVAIALEKNNLHIRIALNILRVIGTEPKWYKELFH
jgi:hypothetical protein